MITVGILAKIRRMYFREKVPLREIARRTGLSRNTVRSWLRQTDAVEPKYPKRVSPSVVDEWAAQLTGWLRAQVEKLCSRAREYGRAYLYPGGHRTSNMLDRLMRSMSRYFEDAQHLHGSKEACELHCRAWALLHNFRTWHPATARANEGWCCPAERLNQHRYHDDWLQNLLVSASLGGYRC